MMAIHNYLQTSVVVRTFSKIFCCSFSRTKTYDLHYIYSIFRRQLKLSSAGILCLIADCRVVGVRPPMQRKATRSWPLTAPTCLRRRVGCGRATQTEGTCLISVNGCKFPAEQQGASVRYIWLVSMHTQKRSASISGKQSFSQPLSFRGILQAPGRSSSGLA